MICVDVEVNSSGGYKKKTQSRTQDEPQSFIKCISADNKPSYFLANRRKRLE